MDRRKPVASAAQAQELVHRRYGASAALGPPASLDASEVRFESFRASGPGGQHQNKTESAVRAVHVPSGLAAVARDGRSQHRNKAVVLERLAMLLRASQDIAAIADQHAVHSKHDRLERGNPVRRFRGRAFEAL
jgi:peptide chain release factor